MVTLVLTVGLTLHVTLCAAGRWGSRSLLRAVATVAVGAAVAGPFVLLPASPVGRMVGVIVLTYCGLEAISLQGAERHALSELPLRAWAVFTFAWPGLRPTALRPGASTEPGIPHRWVLIGLRNVALGATGLAAVALTADRLGDAALGLGIITLLLLALHLGIGDLVSALARGVAGAGYRLIDDPLASRSLTEFWGRRWNRPFAEMNRLLLVPHLRPLGAGASAVGVFTVSGALHELAISYPAGAGYGLPMGYFLLHGLLVCTERRLRLDRWPAVLRRVWTLGWVVFPAPVLFHEAFRRHVVVEPLRAVSPRLPDLTAVPVEQVLATALLAAGAAHFLVLVASFQVPVRLGWREDLASLTPFNRKLMWVYGGFIAGLIAAFGALTLLLHETMLRGGPAAIGLSLLIGLFWAARVIVDAVVFDHGDWPAGWAFVAGHIALTGLFVALSATYLGTAAWHVWGPS